jgi:hypothetical protein
LLSWPSIYEDRGEKSVVGTTPAQRCYPGDETRIEAVEFQSHLLGWIRCDARDFFLPAPSPALPPSLFVPNQSILNPISRLPLPVCRWLGQRFRFTAAQHRQAKRAGATSTSCYNKSVGVRWRPKGRCLQLRATRRRALANRPRLHLRREPRSYRRRHHLARDSLSHRSSRRLLKVFGLDLAAAMVQVTPQQYNRQICGKLTVLFHRINFFGGQIHRIKFCCCLLSYFSSLAL